ncbi:MAG: thiamine pyrophosphate-dependent enzyme [bacterium]|nr:thiamine pyrophosphate-dependent enzyme [bacterium]
MASLKELSTREEIIAPGHRLCPGCGAAIVARMVTKAAKNPLVVACATGCLEVSTTIYPFTSWKSSFLHVAFENSAASLSGAEAAYRALKKKGKIKEDIRFIAFGGDGGTYDIGFQSLSGALERGHRMLIICYDNGAYMNTGIQRSSATPRGADTTTTPVGKVSTGKKEYPKDLTACVVAHNIPYVAQASPSHYADLMRKVEKALDVDGPSFINILSPCPLGWRCPGEDSIGMAKLAVETGFWQLYEVENGEYKMNYSPKERKPLREWLEKQGRFRHLFTPANEHILKELQEHVDMKWEKLLQKSCVNTENK